MYVICLMMASLSGIRPMTSLWYSTDDVLDWDLIDDITVCYSTDDVSASSQENMASHTEKAHGQQGKVSLFTCTHCDFTTWTERNLKVTINYKFLKFVAFLDILDSHLTKQG